MKSLIIFLTLCTPAAAHDHWINRGDYRSPTGTHCCGPNDCFVIPNVRAAPNGYILPDGEVVPFSEALISEDDDYWRCRATDGSRRCFFAPQLGS